VVEEVVSILLMSTGDGSLEFCGRKILHNITSRESLFSIGIISL